MYLLCNKNYPKFELTHEISLLFSSIPFVFLFLPLSLVDYFLCAKFLAPSGKLVWLRLVFMRIGHGHTQGRFAQQVRREYKPQTELDR